jgi:hypothetical protein
MTWGRRVRKVMPHPGLDWNVVSDGPVPAGFVVSDGRLVRFGDPLLDGVTSGGGASWDAGAVAASADRILAEAHAAGWRSPSHGYVAHAIGGGLYDAAGNLCCGECVPCRNQLRSECIAKNSSTAAANSYRRERLRQDNAIEAALREARQHPSGYAPVVTLADGAAEDARRKTLLAALEALS